MASISSTSPAKYNPFTRLLSIVEAFTSLTLTPPRVTTASLSPRAPLTVNGSAFRKTEKRPDDPNDKRIEGYQDFWYTKQYLKAIKSLENLREYAANSGTYERLTMPVLLLYYYNL